MTILTAQWGFWSLFAFLTVITVAVVPVNGIPNVGVLLLFHTALLVLCFWLALMDLRSWRLPDLGTGLLLLVGAHYALIVCSRSPIEIFYGVILGGGFMMGVRLAYAKWRGREGLGLGDVKFMAAAGAWVGADLVLWVVIVAACGILCRESLSGAIRNAKPVTFGPALAASLAFFVLFESMRSWM